MFMDWGDGQGCIGDNVAELVHDARMALLILAMKAILGYTALAWPTPMNLCVRGMLLKDLRIGF